MNSIRTIVVPYDFSVDAQQALEYALELARKFDADLHLLHVVHAPAYAYGSEMLTTSVYVFEPEDYAQERLDEVAAAIIDAPGKVETHVIRGGQIAIAIDALADQLHADLIVMSTHGRTGLAHALVGSVAERTIRRAPCPVLTIRGHPQLSQPARAGESVPSHPA